jgi:hypothetical protein
LSTEQYNIDNNNNNADLIDAAVQTNIDNIATNASNISSNDADIATNAADITTNASDLATETTNRIGGDNALQTQIDTLVVGGVAEPMVAVYKTSDITNTNDYIVSYGTLALFDGLRLNVEVVNSNTGNSTIKLNTELAKPARWRSGGVDYELTQGMFDGISEFQYDASAEVFLLLSRDGVKISSEITSIASISQVGGDVYKDMVVNGQNVIKVDGDGVVNSVKNPNLTNLDNITSAVGGTLAIVGDDLEITATGTSISIWFDLSMQPLEARKAFSKLTFETDTVGGTFSIDLDGSTGGTAQNADTLVPTTANITNDLYGITTEPNDFTGELLLKLVILNATIGEKILVKGKAGVFGIDLTSQNKDIMTVDEVKDKYASNGYLTFGINNVNGNLSVNQSRNLSPKVDGWENGSIDGGGNNTPSATSIRTKEPIKIPEGVTDVTFSVAAGYDAFIVVEYDESGNYVTRSFSSTEINTVSLNANTRSVRLNASEIQIDGFALIKPQLEIGVVADPKYVDPNKTTISLPENLKSLPNGTVDTYNVNTGEVVRNVAPIDGDGYALKSGDFDTFNTSSFTSFDYIQTSILFVDYKHSTTTDDSALLEGYTQTASSIYGDNTSFVNHFFISSDGKLRILLEKNKYANLAEAQSDLAGTKLTYQLATPVQEQHESQQFLLVKGGTIEQDSAVVGELTYDVNLNQPAQVNSNSEAIVAVGQELDIETKQIKTAKTDTGIADALVLSTERSLIDNEVFTVIPKVSNTGACTLSVNGEDARAFEKIDGAGADAALVATDIVLNKPVQVLNRTDKYILI